MSIDIFARFFFSLQILERKKPIQKQTQTQVVRAFSCIFMLRLFVWEGIVYAKSHKELEYTFNEHL